MIEIVFHGRGGHGAVMASELAAIAAYDSGMQSQSFPFFGGERRGAPVKSFTRIDSKPIMLHSQIYNPDIVVILDAELLRIAMENINANSIKEGGSLIMNVPNEESAKKYIEELGISNTKVAYVDATSIASDLGLIVAGWPTINTTMLGALSKATDVIKLDGLVTAINGYWPKALADKNVAAAKKGYDSCKILNSG